NLSDRVSDGAPIVLLGGTITSAGNPATLVTELLGPATIERGLSSILPSQSLKISIGQLSRANRATVQLGNGSVSSLSIRGAVPALSGTGAPGTPQVGILPWGFN